MGLPLSGEKGGKEAREDTLSLAYIYLNFHGKRDYTNENYKETPMWFALVKIGRASERQQIQKIKYLLNLNLRKFCKNNFEHTNLQFHVKGRRNLVFYHTNMSLYMPPMNFGMVADDLYRSGAPNELNFPFLEKLQLKKIIFLAPDDPSQQLYVKLNT
jgi:Tyrosine phosphatase family